MCGSSVVSFFIEGFTYEMKFKLARSSGEIESKVVDGNFRRAMLL